MKLPLASFACLMQLMLPLVYNTTAVAPISPPPSLLPFAQLCGTLGLSTSILTQLGATGCEGPAYYSGIIPGAHPLTSRGPLSGSNVRPFWRPRAISREVGHAMHAVMCITFDSPWLGQSQWSQSCFPLLFGQRKNLSGFETRFWEVASLPHHDSSETWEDRIQAAATPFNIWSDTENIWIVEYLLRMFLRRGTHSDQLSK